MALKPIVNLFSVLVMLFSASLLAPISISFIFKDGAEQIFITALMVAFVPAFLAWLLTRKSKEEMGVKDGFVIITHLLGQYHSRCLACRLLIHSLNQCQE